MKKTTVSLLCLIIAGSSFGAWYISAASGDWSGSSMWIASFSNPATTDILPTSGDSVYVESSKNISLNVDATISSIQSIGSRFAGYGTLSLDQGKSLTVLTTVAIGMTVGGAIGNLDVASGTLNVAGTTTVQPTGKIRVTGDDASISLNTLTTVPGATYDFVLDATGVSTISGSGTFTLSGSTITVDGSDYTLGSGVRSFTLFRSSNLTSVSTSVTVTGFPAGTDASVTQDLTANTVTLRVVPPPALDLIFYTK